MVLLVSMIDATLFDKLEQLGRRIRKTGRPFGDIQLILSGDFFQLPPVSKKSSVGQAPLANFAFDAQSWTECVHKTVVLQTVFRQKESGRLILIVEGCDHLLDLH
jgi:ATP-dependent DNA helicase PIF1